ncbi:MAG TPA: hypothetical protein VJV74_05625 [Terriglobia bacterium]|nr:hypothetical protein [Terriglobia bacterium]
MQAVRLETSVYQFTDHAASRAFEYGLEHEEIIDRLLSGHFKQPGAELGHFTHYLKVGGTPVKVVTAPRFGDPEQTAIVTLLVLDADRR